jgi:hypothetical protein
MTNVQDCTYELYASTYKDARAAVRAGDARRLETIRASVANRAGGEAEACLLALRDAQGKSPRRTKFEVCRPLCQTRCERGV